MTLELAVKGVPQIPKPQGKNQWFAKLYRNDVEKFITWILRDEACKGKPN